MQLQGQHFFRSTGCTCGILLAYNVISAAFKCDGKRNINECDHIPKHHFQIYDTFCIEDKLILYEE